MAKFGELVDTKIPTVTAFYDNQAPGTDLFLDEVSKLAENFGPYIEVVKIDVWKNAELSEALRIKGNTILVYFNGENTARISQRTSYMDHIYQVLNKLLVTK